MRIAMCDGAANRGDVPDADIGQCEQGARDDGGALLHVFGTLKAGKRRHRAPMVRPSSVALMDAYRPSIFLRLTSFAGRNTPAFIINISAVPPATGRTVSSSGSRSAIAAAREAGWASSNGIIRPDPRIHQASNNRRQAIIATA